RETAVDLLGKQPGARVDVGELVVTALTQQHLRQAGETDAWNGMAAGAQHLSIDLAHQRLGSRSGLNQHRLAGLHAEAVTHQRPRPALDSWIHQAPVLPVSCDVLVAVAHATDYGATPTPAPREAVCMSTAVAVAVAPRRHSAAQLRRM